MKQCSLSSLFDRVFRPLWQKLALLIRLMVGAVFLSEGIQKFLFADQLDAPS
jgi:putative oxidoreductase